MWYRIWLTLLQVMSCCLVAPSHYLNHCWLIISDNLLHSHESNLKANAKATILCNEFKNFTFKIMPHLPGGNEWMAITVAIAAVNDYCQPVLMTTKASAADEWCSTYSNTSPYGPQCLDIPVLYGDWPFCLTLDIFDNWYEQLYWVMVLLLKLLLLNYSIYYICTWIIYCKPLI